MTDKEKLKEINKIIKNLMYSEKDIGLSELCEELGKIEKLSEVEND